MPTKPRTHLDDVREREQRLGTVATRPDAGSRGYGGQWRRIRAAVLKREPLCRHCAARGRTTAAREVDHVVPLSRGGTHAEENLQPLCRACHARKTAAESRGETPSAPRASIDGSA